MRLESQWLQLRGILFQEVDGVGIGLDVDMLMEGERIIQH